MVPKFQAEANLPVCHLPAGYLMAMAAGELFVDP